MNYAYSSRGKKIDAILNGRGCEHLKQLLLVSTCKQCHKSLSLYAALTKKKVTKATVSASQQSNVRSNDIIYFDRQVGTKRTSIIECDTLRSKLRSCQCEYTLIMFFAGKNCPAKVETIKEPPLIRMESESGGFRKRERLLTELKKQENVKL